MHKLECDDCGYKLTRVNYPNLLGHWWCCLACNERAAQQRLERAQEEVVSATRHLEEVRRAKRKADGEPVDA
jgi:hypothetical protein